MTTLIAPAKINLFLSVGALRPDGYHAVTAVNAVLGFGDEVSVEPAAALSVTCRPDVGVPAERNLAWLAAVAMGEAFGREPAFDIRIAKRIPAGAGLGGGSSDAAAVIAALAAAWGLDRDDPRLETIARGLGADVPTFLRGGCAVYAGRGDVMRRALPTPFGQVAVVYPGTQVGTADAYRAFDDWEAREPQPHPAPRDVTDAVCFRDPQALGRALHNNMTRSSVHLAPAIADALAFIQAAPGCLGVAMTGSGSAVFGLFADAEGAHAAADDAERHGWWSVATAFRDSGAFDETMGARGGADQGRRRHPRRR